MTAAALRPDLLTHLFASRREHYGKADHAATALSILFHVGIVGALIWGSAQLPKPKEVPVITPIIPITFTPAQVEGTHAGGGGVTGVQNGPLPTISIPDPLAPVDPRPVDQGVWHEPSTSPDVSSRFGAGNPGVGNGVGQTGETRDGFAVLTTLPRLLNEAEVKRELERAYPAFLRDAGIGGEVLVWLLLDENGRVVKTEVKSGSGHAALDEAALRVGEMMRFSPARNRDRDVRVWVSVPFRFTTR